MEKTIDLQKNTPVGLLFSGVTMAVFVFSFFGVQDAHAAISGQLDFGDRGSEVTELQTYLSTNPNFYPSGLVTGYFGPLTKAGVERFQTNHGIVHSGTPATTGYGRVGPRTRAAINAELSGGGNTGGDVSAPMIRNVSVQTDNDGATVTWTTNESATARVYYDTTPIRINNTFDVTGPNSIDPTVSGNLAQYDGVTRTAHSIDINNLSSNTRYYYLITVTDPSGNMSITTPASFRTE